MKKARRNELSGSWPRELHQMKLQSMKIKLEMHLENQNPQKMHKLNPNPHLI
jgi:hypothetical protein